MKNEKQVLLDELDSLMTKFDESWNERNLWESWDIYDKIYCNNKILGIPTPNFYKLVDYSKLSNSEIKYCNK